MPKRTYQPKKRKRSKKHGFRKRRKSSGGKNILKRRSKKGRENLTPVDKRRKGWAKNHAK